MTTPSANSHSSEQGVRVEPDRVSVRAIVRFAILLAVISVVALAVVGGLFQLLERRTKSREAGPTPVEAEHPVTAEQRLPPEPRLEIDPGASLARLRAEENARLETYGWVDKSAGVVRIPIERAMELMVEREKKK
jgi:hypothetical protein